MFYFGNPWGPVQIAGDQIVVLKMADRLSGNRFVDEKAIDKKV